ncbi:hypothetical protein D5086_010736 [Populus alba]|uniref:Uncharacterized protein n=1 Tax=Populus alba TaxID=43335 RepID=A0ACC4CBM8_POPAL
MRLSKATAASRFNNTEKQPLLLEDSASVHATNGEEEEEMDTAGLLWGFRYGAEEVIVFAAGTGRIPVSSPFFLQHVSAAFIYRRSLERYQLSSSFPSSPFNPLLINPCPS